MRVLRPYIFTLLLVTIFAAGAQAQSVRSLGMGGVVAPGSASTSNPAYGAFEESRVDVPLPLGALSLLTRGEAFGLEGEDIDFIVILDQAARLNEFLLNPASMPDAIDFDTVEVDGQPVLVIEVEGGSRIAVLEGDAYRASFERDLPLRFPVGSVTVGVRPYVNADADWRPSEDFADLFTGGSSTASGELSAELDAGVALEVSYATEIDAATLEFPGRLFVGATLSPFVSLVSAQADVAASVALTAAEAEVEFAGEVFLAGLTNGQVGFGAYLDLGLATIVPLEEGDVYAGFSVRNLGYGFYRGEVFTFAGDDLVLPSLEDGTPAIRAGFLGMPDLTLTGAIDLNPASIDVEGELASLVVASDFGLTNGRLMGHVGVEAGFDVDAFGTIYTRAGGGYDSGLVFGVGAGVRADGIGVDAAFHGRNSVLAREMIYGLSAGLSFGF